MKKLKLTILTPERPIVQDKEVDFVAFPAYEGEMGVLPGHEKAVVLLQHGILRYKNGDQQEEFAVMGGFAEVFKDNISVLAEDAALAGEVDEEAERQKIAKTKQSLSSHDADIDFELAEIELKASLMKMKIKNRGQRRSK
ncbi:F-type H+-transporting ATPase subunit epsilon [Elusimicrobium simillimum]|uniref:ATP synthase F1 subunit epsilon n=1 Tax=Elusimicrobium simillimum TaxID=3143438 RepID=UPI003C6FE754